MDNPPQHACVTPGKIATCRQYNYLEFFTDFFFPQCCGADNKVLSCWQQQQQHADQYMNLHCQALETCVNKTLKETIKKCNG